MFTKEDQQRSRDRATQETTPHRELVRTEHYTVERGRGVRFYYAEGTVAGFPPHKIHG